MAFCEKCLREVAEGEVLCAECAAEEMPTTETPAAPVQESDGAPQFRPQFVAPPAPRTAETPFRVPLRQEQLPPAFKPLGAWAYFGYSLLFAIPLVGFIVLLVMALGGTENVNLRNYARSYFCAYLVCLLLTAIAVALILGFGISLPMWPM